MKSIAVALFFAIITLLSPAADESLETKLLEKLDEFSTSETYLSKATKNPEVLSSLLEEKFSIEALHITSKRLKAFKKRKIIGWVLWDDGSAFKLQNEDVLEVQFDTGYAGGFIALVKKDDLKVLHVLIVPEG